MDSATTPPSSKMDSTIWQRLPNELIENVFKCADSTDKPLCAAICLTNKVGRRVMYGINEKGENVGPSPMYGTVGIADLNCTIEWRCRYLHLLIRTLLERPDLLESVTTLVYLIPSLNAMSKITIEAPGFIEYRQKIRSMNLPRGVIANLFPDRKFPSRINGNCYERMLWMFLLVISTNLKSMKVSHTSGLLDDLTHASEDLQQARGLSDDPANLGRTGLDSLNSLVHSPVGYGPHKGLAHGLGLNLPRLRRLTVYNISSWLPTRFTGGTSTVEEIHLIECLPDEVLCAPVGRRGRCLLAVCPALKKLHVTRTGPLEWEFLNGRFGSSLARELNRLLALEEICFTTAQPPSQLYPSGEAIVPHNYNGFCSNAAVGRLGSIKNLCNLKKLTLPMAACVGRDLDNGYPKDYPRDESPGAHQNFIGFLQNSLPDDVSQIEMKIISPKTRLSAEDDVLLASASFKKFKSLTIYDCTRDSCISSLDQVTSVQNAVEASLLAM